MEVAGAEVEGEAEVAGEAELACGHGATCHGLCKSRHVVLRGVRDLRTLPHCTRRHPPLFGTVRASPPSPRAQPHAGYPSWVRAPFPPPPPHTPHLHQAHVRRQLRQGCTTGRFHCPVRLGKWSGWVDAGRGGWVRAGRKWRSGRDNGAGRTWRYRWQLRGWRPGAGDSTAQLSRGSGTRAYGPAAHPFAPAPLMPDHACPTPGRESCNISR